MKISKDSYTFIEHKGEDDVWYIKIKEGAYKDIVYKYGHIEVVELPTGEANLKFHFKASKIPDDLGLDEMDLNNDVEFCNLLGDILVNILEDAMETGKYKLGNNDKPTDSESTVHE